MIFLKNIKFLKLSKLWPKDSTDSTVHVNSKKHTLESRGRLYGLEFWRKENNTGLEKDTVFARRCVLSDWCKHCSKIVFGSLPSLHFASQCYRLKSKLALNLFFQRSQSAYSSNRTNGMVINWGWFNILVYCYSSNEYKLVACMFAFDKNPHWLIEMKFFVSVICLLSFWDFNLGHSLCRATALTLGVFKPTSSCSIIFYCIIFCFNRDEFNCGSLSGQHDGSIAYKCCLYFLTKTVVNIIIITWFYFIIIFLNTETQRWNQLQFEQLSWIQIILWNTFWLFL